jgi:EAL domain-containing protein (putative c-di-GMP-specific phosphodiesterase class I)/CheY-like chemotaxis protein
VERIRVLVADDDPHVRDAMIDLIGNEPSLDLVAVAEDAGEAIELAERFRPEVALVDVRMAGGGGARVARELRARSSETRVIAVSAHPERDITLHMLGAGVTSCLVKGASSEEILAAIHECVEGNPTFSSGVTPTLVEEVSGYLRKREEDSAALLRRSIRALKVIQGEGLAVALQPIVDLETGAIDGVEALARFSPPPPEWGPLQWFQEAEAVGLRVELEQAALVRCLEELNKLPDRWFLAVNLSPDTITTEATAKSLQHEQSSRIIVEITEHAPVTDYDEVFEALADFRSRGGRLAIDDAGAGFASLRHVVALLPDVIKLDISLTRGIDQDRNRRALASAMISFATEIGATIVAEGIETPEVLEALRALGVRYGQGFHLGRPRRIQRGDNPEDAFEQNPPSAA